jgi:two-component system, OmpR family, sensor histidine kinase PhoQ
LRTGSLQTRLVVAVSLVLAAFLGLTGVALEQAYRDSAETAIQEKLKGQVYALLGAADVDKRGRLRLPESLPDPRLSEPDSGLYAQVEGEKGKYNWQSPSMIGRKPATIEPTPAGEWRFRKTDFPTQMFILSFGVLWEDNAGAEQAYTIMVSQTADSLISQVESFRFTMFLWLGGSALILLFAQVAVLRWGLTPLRQVAADLKHIEAGEADALEGEYPKELLGLTQNINSLISHGRASQERYRNSLGDLAHSLKTPLAVLQGAVDSQEQSALREAVIEQLPRMDEIVRYQLQRASASGRSDVTRAQQVAPVVTKIINTLHKVYRDKKVSCSQELDRAAQFYGDKGDLMEFLGNLLENAFKYCEGSVLVRVVGQSTEPGIRSSLQIVIGDDGPGIPESERERVIGRGERQDQRQPGQGIGLSVADDIVRLYGGELKIGHSELGGAEITLGFGAN